MKKLFLLPAILLFTAATYGPPFSVSDFSSLTNRPNPSAVNPVGVVLGKTNAYDGNGGIFVFTPSSTNAVDDDIYLTTTTTGRWVRLTRDIATIQSPLVLSNGTLSLAALTNYFTFLTGTNMQVTVTSNTVTYAMTNTTGGGSGNLITVNGGLVTNFWDNGYITFLNAGGGDYSLNIGDDTISTNKINSTFYNWVLSLSGGGGGTTNGLGVNGTFRTDWNAINSAEIAYTVSAGTNWYGSLIAGSVGANKLATTGTGTSTNFLAGDYAYKQVTTNMIPGLNAILATIGSGGGSGGGLGTNFVLNGVMQQPAIITNGLSVLWSTNANGHVLAAVSLVDSNIPSTIARLDSPTFTGTVTFDTLVANTLQIPFASRYAAANSSSNLVATSDGASWTNLNGSSIASGTVADARIDAALARLASPTFTGDPKAPTASPGDNDTSIASTAFVTAAVAAGGGGGGTGTVVTANGGSDMSRANITTNGFGLLVTQSGTNILLSTTNNYPVDYYAGGFLPLYAGLSNALTGALHFKKSSDIRVPMWESGTEWNAMGMRASGGVWSVAEYNTNDFTVLESFITIDPTDTTGPTDIITFPNSGFNNKVVFEADVEFNGTVTGGGTWDGTPIASGTITNLIVSQINQRDYYNTGNGDWWHEGGPWNSSAFLPQLGGGAIASGTIGNTYGFTNNPVVYGLFSSSTTNSGYYFSSTASSAAHDIGGGGDEVTFILSLANTNQIQGSWGFIDSTALSESTDGAYFRLDNGYIQGVLANNGSYSRTITSNLTAVAASTFHRYVLNTSSDATYVTFCDLSPSGTGWVTNWTDSVTNTLPTGSARLTGIGVVVINRATPSAIELIRVDAIGKRSTRILRR